MTCLDFSKGNVTLIVSPVDMRCGYDRLACAANELAGIDVEGGNEIVVFVSKNRRLAKVIHTDVYGRTLITRRLRSGSFERFLMRQGCEAKMAMTAKELENYLNGQSIFVEREFYFR